MNPNEEKKPIDARTEEALIAAYVEQATGPDGLPLDELPYTPELERLTGAVWFRTDDYSWTTRTVWRALRELRKAGRLPEPGKGDSA